MYSKAIGTYSKNDVDIQFAYWSSPKGVTIDEENYHWTWGLNPGDSYIQIKGIDVLQISATNYDSGVLVDQYSYEWYQNGVSFTVNGWDYAQEDIKMVAESMIK
jgi:hypothetical protein